MSGQTSRQRIVTLCVHFFNIDSKRKRSVLWKKYFKYNIVRFVIEYKLKMLYSNYYKL